MGTKARHADSGSAKRTLWTLFVFIAAAGLFQTTANAAIEVVEEGIRFTHKAPNAASVSLAGAFNEWSTTTNPMAKKDDVWEVVVPLEAGTHEYKFVVDGQWIADPDNPVTTGEFGNSAVTVGDGGGLTEMKATSNTPLSPKMLMDGRAIGYYLFEENPNHDDRLEMRKPQIDFDLGFKIRINQDLDAYILTNVSNEAENVEAWETQLNFDRGALTLENSEIFAQAWDNHAIGTWDDPLHLIGNIGIYNYDYGYRTVGARIVKRFWGFEGEVLYSDDADTGGESGPDPSADNLVKSPGFVLNDEGRFEFATSEIYEYAVANTDNIEDVLAAQIRRPLGRALSGDWSASGLFRLDRGSRPGGLIALQNMAIVDTFPAADALVFGNTFEEWLAGGGELQYVSDRGIVVRSEFLRGEAQIDAGSGLRQPVVLVTLPGDEEPTPGFVGISPAQSVSDKTFDLDTSNRFFLGATWDDGPLGVGWDASLEYEGHKLAAVATGLLDEIDNSATIWRGSAERSWGDFPMVDRAVDAEIGFEFFDFSYADDAPWDSQIWFDRRNFWLDLGQHKVDYHKLTLLGGNDAWIWRPGFRVQVDEDHRVDLSYSGLLGSQGFDRNPKYFESIFVLQGYVARNWRAQLDTRIVRYDDPTLELSQTFTSNFVEIAYTPIEGVSLALSYGVDPWVLDPFTNEYGYIGRDRYLFGKGANAGTAQTNYLTMGRVIEEAEQLLEEERRFQLEAVLNF